MTIQDLVGDYSISGKNQDENHEITYTRYFEFIFG